MSIAPISSNVAAPTPSSPTDNASSTAKASQDAQVAAIKAKTDTVIISKQALQLASDGDSAAQELKESAAEQASERLRGKK